jgi:hypothetical protein
MLASIDRTEALRLLKIEHEAVQALIDSLTAEEMTRPDTIRYGLYSDQRLAFKDLLAHLICYEVYAIQAINDWKIKTQHWVIDAIVHEGLKIHYGGIADRAHLTLDEQLEECQQVYAQLETIFATLTDAEWRAEAFYPTNTPTDLGGMIERIVVAPPRPMYRHLPVHIPDADAYIASLRA